MEQHIWRLKCMYFIKIQYISTKKNWEKLNFPMGEQKIIL